MTGLLTIIYWLVIVVYIGSCHFGVTTQHSVAFLLIEIGICLAYLRSMYADRRHF